MLDGQFDLDGYVFGHPGDPCVVLVDGWDMGEDGIVSQDKAMPFSDSLAFGRDTFQPPTWTFTIGIRDTGDGDFYRHLQNLRTAWRGDAVRGVPGALSTLRYRRDGEERIVYGRPRKFAVEKDKTWDRRWKIVTCTFQLASPMSYGATLHDLELDLVNTSSSTGLVFPTVFPWTFQRSTNVREGLVSITTGLPTPFKLTIRGPVSGEATDFRVASSLGWSMRFATYLSPRGNIVVDTDRGIATRNGVPFAAGSAVTAYRSRLMPGAQEISFSANDPSFTSSAVLSWRDVSPTF